VVGVQQWAEIRRLYRVERLSIRGISRRTGLHRKTVLRALAAAEPPRYVRATIGSKADPFKDWICEQLALDPRIQSQRLREMVSEIGYEGGKSIFDDCVREVRPRFVAARTFQRTVYRPGELVQCDLWSVEGCLNPAREAGVVPFIGPFSSQHPYRSTPRSGPRSPGRVRVRRIAFLLRRGAAQSDDRDPRC
jgi:transposase